MKKSKENGILIKKEKIGKGQYILSFCLILYTIFCALPILLVFVSAFTDESCFTSEGFTYFPSKWSSAGFMAVLKYGRQLTVSYGVTIGVTLSGTLLGLLLMSMFAYALTRKDFALKKFLTVFITIPMLFNGGQLASYIINCNLYHMKDNILILILPCCVSTMNIIIMKTYIKGSVPEELMESARIDGAGEWRTFFQITMPLMKPCLASVGFMMATAYWNDWQSALLYINSDSKKPLQLLLINISKSIDMLLNSRNVPSSALAAMQGTIPSNSATMATVLIVIGPIMIAYPFFQKYFAKGITMGSVKG